MGLKSQRVGVAIPKQNICFGEFAWNPARLSAHEIASPAVVRLARAVAWGLLRAPSPSPCINHHHQNRIENHQSRSVRSENCNLPAKRAQKTAQPKELLLIIIYYFVCNLFVGHFIALRCIALHCILFP